MEVVAEDDGAQAVGSEHLLVHAQQAHYAAAAASFAKLNGTHLNNCLALFRNFERLSDTKGCQGQLAISRPLNR